MKKISKKDISLSEVFWFISLILSFFWWVFHEDLLQLEHPPFLVKFSSYWWIISLIIWGWIRYGRVHSHINDINTNFTSIEERLSKIEKKLEDK